MRTVATILLLLSAMCIASPPVTYPVPGGDAYLSDQGKVAVAPTGSTQQYFNFPAMGMNSNKFIPLAVTPLGELFVTSTSGAPNSNVNLHDFAGNGISSTMVGPKNGLDVNVVDFPATQDVNVTNASLPVTQSGIWTVAATQSGPWSVGRTWSLSDSTDSVAATQNGPWTTGRTWTLSSGSDSVSASVSNFPALQDVNLARIGGAAPGVTNWVPARVTNGTSYVDPTQIRALSASTDSVSVEPGLSPIAVTVQNTPIPVTQSGTWTTGRTWALGSGTDSVTTIQGTSPWVVSGSGNFTVVQPSGASLHVDVDNFPATVAVTQSTSPWVVSGSVTANIGTTGGLALDATLSETHGSSTGGTSASKSDLSGGIYNSTPPALTNGQQAALQVDSSGNLKTTATLTASSVTANQGSPNSIANSWPVEVTDGTNILGTSSHPVRTDPTGTTIQPVSGTVTANQGGTWTVQQGSPPWSVSQSGSWTVTANAGTNLNTSALALDTSVNGILLSQGSTTSGQKGPLVQGAVTTSSPSYTTAQTSPLSLTTAGALRVDASGTTQPVSGTVTANQGTSPWVVSGTITANQGTSPWVTNVSQFGGSNVTTGTGASGSGIPRVTVSNDSNVLATQSGTWTVQQGTPPWSVTQSGAWTTGRTWTLSSGTDSIASVQSGTWTVQQGTPPWTIQGDSASGAAKAGNPVQIGGVFNTTQPTVTTGQTVESQSTARGGLIVATGADTFSVSAAQSGTWTVQQGSAPWSFNQTQINGTTLLAGNGVTGAGSQRVTIASDNTAFSVNSIQSGTWTVQPGNTANTTPWLSTINQGGNSATVTASNALKVDGSAVTQPVSGTVTANQGGAPWSVSQSGTWTVQQGSAPWSVVGNIASGSADSGNPEKTGAVFNTTLPTVTNGQRVDNQADANGRQIVTNVPIDGSKVTCRAAFTGLASATLATDIFTIQGSGTKTIKVIAAELSATVTTANQFNLLLIKRSTADTGGTSSTLTNVVLDSNDSACTALVKTYTANPTLGTAVGAIEVDKIFAAAAGANTTPEPATYSFGNRPSQALTLRGTAENAAFNLNAVTLAGSSFDGWIEWTEE